MKSSGGSLGMAKHRKSGHTTKSPKFRNAMKLQAERDVKKDTKRIKEPKGSIEELFHGKR